MNTALPSSRAKPAGKRHREPNVVAVRRVEKLRAFSELKRPKKPGVLGARFTREASPGSRDSLYLFERFTR